MKKSFCESCGMPFAKDMGVRESDKYCSLCFKNGEFCYKGVDIKEFQRICIEGMKKHGIPGWLAWLFSLMIPRLSRWKK